MQKYCQTIASNYAVKCSVFELINMLQLFTLGVRLVMRTPNLLPSCGEGKPVFFVCFGVFFCFFF